MTPRKIMTLSFTLAAFVASGSFLSACGSSPDGEYTYKETESTDGPAPCTSEDECVSDSDCGTGSFCNTEECVCQEAN